MCETLETRPSALCARDFQKSMEKEPRELSFGLQIRIGPNYTVLWQYLQLTSREKYPNVQARVHNAKHSQTSYYAQTYIYIRT